ncbi:hypothetical protein GCM10009630_55110 [Kribbella jejuensis]|uniref:Uncharacterized protein n=1 Tax=Kribbella jejuensis TaxID=236068 RepID=A0A542EWQ5_9ACTN|nr:hypothetical protein [Kribbella jejuensis]TQJ19576.1 hypothetical protein FB475_3746 [Kribbella jejuensis]
MRRQNGRLAALVAAVAVAAVAVGGALAYRQDPQANAEGVTAAPLPTSSSITPTAGVSTTTSSTPKATPSVTPSPRPSAGPVKTRINLALLTTGRAPQIAYLSGRTIRGGAGEDVTVPGTSDIQEVARLGNSSLAVVSKGSGNEMLTLDSTGKITARTPDITQIVTTEDDSAAAYGGNKLKDTGAEVAGATVYAEQAQAQGIQKVTVPGIWNTTLHAYVDGKVYFSASTTQAGPSALYEWTPGKSAPLMLNAVPNPLAVSSAGTAASLTSLADQASCSTLLTVPKGKRLWRTCDYMITGFTLDGATAIAGSRYQDGYGDGIAAALDAKNNGKLLHEWSGIFRKAVPEDDEHLLLLADDGEGTPAAIVRCTISTGACELATPLAKGNLLIGA